MKQEQDNQENEALNRLGCVIRGARNIAAYMKVSPGTISRWRKRFRGRTEVRLCFPAVNIPTGTGRGWQLMTHTGLILDWMQRWSDIDGEALRQKPTWRRRRKAQALGETAKMPPAAGKEAPILREGLSQLSDPEREWTIRNELTPPHREDLGVRVPESLPRTQPIQAAVKRCTCGTPTPCEAPH